MSTIAVTNPSASLLHDLDGIEPNNHSIDANDIRRESFVSIMRNGVDVVMSKSAYDDFIRERKLKRGILVKKGKNPDISNDTLDALDFDDDNMLEYLNSSSADLSYVTDDISDSLAHKPASKFAYFDAVRAGVFEQMDDSEFHGWSPPAYGNISSDSCGKLNVSICDGNGSRHVARGHASPYTAANILSNARHDACGSADVIVSRDWCYKHGCPTCFCQANRRRAVDAGIVVAGCVSESFTSGIKGQKYQAGHATLTVPKEMYHYFETDDGAKTFMRMVAKDLKGIGIAGFAVITHPWRFKDGIRHPYWSPHLHLIVLGWTIANEKYDRRTKKEKDDNPIEYIVDFHKRTGMNYKYIRTLPAIKSYISTLEYLLSHAGFKERKKSIGYYGCLSAGSRDSKQIMANQNDIVNTPILDLPDVEKIRRKYRDRITRIQVQHFNSIGDAENINDITYYEKKDSSGNQRKVSGSNTYEFKVTDRLPTDLVTDPAKPGYDPDNATKNATNRFENARKLRDTMQNIRVSDLSFGLMHDPSSTASTFHKCNEKTSKFLAINNPAWAKSISVSCNANDDQSVIDNIVSDSEHKEDSLPVYVGNGSFMSVVIFYEKIGKDGKTYEKHHVIILTFDPDISGLCEICHGQMSFGVPVSGCIDLQMVLDTLDPKKDARHYKQSRNAYVHVTKEMLMNGKPYIDFDGEMKYSTGVEILPTQYPLFSRERIEILKASQNLSRARYIHRELRRDEIMTADFTDEENPHAARMMLKSDIRSKRSSRLDALNEHITKSQRPSKYDNVKHFGSGDWDDVRSVYFDAPFAGEKKTDKKDEIVFTYL